MAVWDDVMVHFTWTLQIFSSFFCFSCLWFVTQAHLYYTYQLSIHMFKTVITCLCLQCGVFCLSFDFVRLILGSRYNSPGLQMRPQA